MTISLSNSFRSSEQFENSDTETFKQIQEAILDGNIQKFRLLLQNNEVNLNRQNEDGLTLLSVAVIAEQYEIIRLLLEMDVVDPNIPSTVYGGPLFISSCYGYLTAIQLLLNSPKIDPNQVAFGSPLVEACKFGHLAVAEELLNFPKTDVNLPDKDGLTPLCAAVLYDEEKIVDALLQHPLINPTKGSSLSDSIEDQIHNFKSPSSKYIDLSTEEKKDIFTPLSIAVLLDNSHIAKRLTADPRVNPLSIDVSGDSALKIALNLGSKKVSRVKVHKLPVELASKSTAQTSWTHVSFLPVSNDKDHSPPKEFPDTITELSLKYIRSSQYGEIEIIPVTKQNSGNESNSYKRVVYRCKEYVTVSLLNNCSPIGVTIYRPLLSSLNHKSTLKAQMVASPHFWHIANNSVSTTPEDLLESIQLLGRKNLCVFRALNADHDPLLLLNGNPLIGRGHSKKVKTQVDSGGTALVSVSTRPMTKFLADKQVKNGGFVCILTELGAQLFLGGSVSLPGFMDHQFVVDSLKNNDRLVRRVRDASEAMFYTPIDTDLIVYMDNGYPTSSNKRKPPSISETPSREVLTLLDKFNVDFGALPKDLQKILLSNKGLRKKRQALEDILR